MTSIGEEQKLSGFIENFVNEIDYGKPIVTEKVISRINEIEIAKKLFITKLPDIVPLDIRKDLAYLFIYKIANQEMKKNILQKWCIERNSDPEDATKLTYEFPDGSAYRSVYDLLLYDRMTNGLFLPSIVSNIRDLKKYEYVLNLKEACDYIKLHSLISYNTPLDEIDIKIVELLSKNSTITNQEIANRLRVSRNTISTKLNKLKEHGCIFFNGIVDFKRLGLNILYVLTDRIIPKIPYLRVIQEMRGGASKFLHSFNIPEEYLIDFIEILRKYIKDAEFWFSEDVGRSSLALRNSYDAYKKEWSINWENWALWVRKVLSEMWHTIYVSGDKDEKEFAEKSYFKKQDFDIKDLEILNLLTINIRMPIRDLAKKLNISQTNAYERKSRLIDEGIIRPTLFIENIGLDENVFIKVKGSNNLINSIESSLLDLPKVYLFKWANLSGENCLSSFIFLPKGSLVMVDYILKQYLEDAEEDIDFKVYYQLKQTYISQGLPYSYEGTPLYIEDLKKWIWPYKKIVQVLKNL